MANLARTKCVLPYSTFLLVLSSVSIACRLISCMPLLTYKILLTLNVKRFDSVRAFMNAFSCTCNYICNERDVYGFGYIISHYSNVWEGYSVCGRILCPSDTYW